MYFIGLIFLTDVCVHFTLKCLLLIGERLRAANKNARVLMTSVYTHPLQAFISFLPFIHFLSSTFSPQFIIFFYFLTTSNYSYFISIPSTHHSRHSTSIAKYASITTLPSPLLHHCTSIPESLPHSSSNITLLFTTHTTSTHRCVCEAWCTS